MTPERQRVFCYFFLLKKIMSTFIPLLLQNLRPNIHTTNIKPVTAFFPGISIFSIAGLYMLITYRFFLHAITKRYISRNIKLYINYLNLGQQEKDKEKKLKNS